jgi:dTDP-4-amino-4,6-dideoxygalactose transaminase
VQAALGPHVRCIVPVHLYGQTVDLRPIVALAREHGIAVIEDACQAHGALLGGRRAGSLADAGCFSFYPSKNLGAWGDAGAIVTNDERLAERVRMLRAHGERTRCEHEIVGTTARLDAIQAAVLRVKLRHLDEWNAARRHAAAALAEALRDTPVVPPAPPHRGADHVFHQFVIRCEHRDALRAHLAKAGIATAIHYPVPIHLTAAYAGDGRNPQPSLPVVERLAKRILSLPMHSAISDEEIARVGAAVQAFHR